MLILPIKNINPKTKIDSYVNTQIKFANQELVKSGKDMALSASNINVCGYEFSGSSYDEKHHSLQMITEFVRECSKSVNSHIQKSCFVSTKVDPETGLYDIYSIELPKEKVSDELDVLYGRVVLDIKSSLPNKVKGKYISFDEVGLGKYFNMENLFALESITRANGNYFNHDDLSDNEDLQGMVKALEFMELFDCAIIPKTTMKASEIDACLSKMSVLNTDVYQKMKKMKQIAEKNREIYMIMSKSNTIINKTPFKLIHKEKQLIKKAA